MKLLIDGYNLFKNIFKKSDLTLQEKDSLLHKLIDYSEKKQLPTFVVFDGGELPNRYVERHKLTTVVYAGTYKKADPLIIQMMSELQGEVVLITSDRELINKARSHKIFVLSTAHFAPLFTKPKNALTTKYRMKDKPIKFNDSTPSSIDKLMEESLNMVVEKNDDKPNTPLQENSTEDKKILQMIKRLSL